MLQKIKQNFCKDKKFSGMPINAKNGNNALLLPLLTLGCNMGLEPTTTGTTIQDSTN